MNVNQMHIAVQQGVDKINSLQADMLLSQEIDIELNKSMSRFINSKYGKNNIYRKGFEESQKRIDDLRSLVTEYEAPAFFKEEYRNFFIDQFKLPADYLYLVNQRSEIFKNDCNPIGYAIDQDHPASYFVVPFHTLIKETSDGTLLSEGMGIFADITDPSVGHAIIGIGQNFVYPDDISALRDYYLDSGNIYPGFEVFWEQYGNLDFPNSFIVIVDTNTHSFFNWDASVGTNLITNLVVAFEGSANAADADFNNYVYPQYSENTLGSKRIPIDPNGSTRELTYNKFIQQDDIFKLLDDPFNTTKPSSPLTTIRGEYIDIYTSDIFIIDNVKITYIRKPKEISLTLGISCELPSHTHQEIVDRTVSSILEGISDPRYQSHELEVRKNE